MQHTWFGRQSCGSYVRVYMDMDGCDRLFSVTHVSHVEQP